MDKFQKLQKRIDDLESLVKSQGDFIMSLQRSATIPLGIDQSFRERFKDLADMNSNDLTGILKANGGTTDLTAISPLSGNNTVYVASSSGGAVTTGLNLTDGIVVSLS